jgi:hypothetical protein
LVRVVGQATLIDLSECNFKHCRFKRQNQQQQQQQQQPSLQIHLETPKVIFKHQQNGNQSSENILPILFRLSPTDPSTLLSPNYKLVVRGDDAQALEVNRTLPSLDCHFTGKVEGLENSRVAFSFCDNNLVS